MSEFAVFVTWLGGGAATLASAYLLARTSAKSGHSASRGQHAAMTALTTRTKTTRDGYQE